MNLANSSTMVRPVVPISERSFPTPRARLLLIEDDLEIAGELASDLTDRGYEVRHAGTSGQAECDHSEHNKFVHNECPHETPSARCGTHGLRRLAGDA